LDVKARIDHSILNTGSISQAAWDFH